MLRTDKFELFLACAGIVLAMVAQLFGIIHVNAWLFIAGAVSMSWSGYQLNQCWKDDEDA